MKVTCAVCRKEFEAQRSSAKFCSPACKMRATRESLLRAGDAAEKVITDSIATRVDLKFPDDPIKQKNYEGFLKKIPPIEWLKTGTPLDELSGLPKNKISLLYGKYGIGKTTLAHMIASKPGIKTLYVDTEASLTSERLADLGVDCSNFDIERKAYIEDVYDLLHNEANLKKYDLIIWDSVANTSSRTEFEGDSIERHIGAKALIMNKLMRILPNQLDTHKCTLLLINQEREGIGMYAENYIPGGKGQLYSSSIIVRLTGKYPKVKAEVTKSRVSNVGKMEFSF